MYPSEEGLHFELYTSAEAQDAYNDAKSRNVPVELNALILTWKFPNQKKNLDVDIIPYICGL